MLNTIRTSRYLKGKQINKEFSRNFWDRLKLQGLSSNQMNLLIYDILIETITSYSNSISATIDTKDQNAVVTVEYGLTTEYGSEIPITEGVINGIVSITANLIL